MQKELESYFDRLWPICRSITGNGLRQSLGILQELIPLQLKEVKSGTPVFDWVIPDEWNIRDAYIICPDGRKVADFKSNNLHILNYSEPQNREITFEELQAHLFYLPEMPDAIPYLTSYYKRTWGFCLSYNTYQTLDKSGTYKVVIDSDLKPGYLTYGEYLLPGLTEEEILFSTYVCHPSMANNELSGPLVAAFLYKKLSAFKNRRYSYRFVFAPETVGVIAFLHQQGFHLKEWLRAGYVLTCCGDAGNYTYKKSKNEADLVNRAALHVLKYQDESFRQIPFSIGGSDERQYCSPGFNFPVGSLMRTPYQQYREYHTSADNKSFISFEAMERTVNCYADIVKTIELNRKFRNTIPYGEPQLGKRGLYTSLGGQKSRADALSKRLHLLSFADGKTDMMEIAERFGQSVLSFEPTIEELTKAELLVVSE